MDKPRTKTSRLKRKIAQPIKLTDRDEVILRALHSYRFLTTKHLEVLTKTESRWAMNKRLRLLYDHKYIDRPKAQAAIFSHADERPTVYALGNKGAKLLSERFNIAMPLSVYWTEKNRRVRERHIEHTLGIANVIVGIDKMCRASDHVKHLDMQTILNRSPIQTGRAKYPFRWKTQIKHDGERHDIAIVPDHIFGIQNDTGTSKRNEKFYFVEVDRGTMPVTRRDITQSSIIRKVLSYADTLDRNLAEKRFGMKGFQVLIVTTSEKRIQAMQDAIATLPDTSFSANTFLFRVKDNSQTHFPFYSGWQNSKGAAVSLF